jgi:carboxylesterase type B
MRKPSSLPLSDASGFSAVRLRSERCCGDSLPACAMYRSSLPAIQLCVPVYVYSFDAGDVHGEDLDDLFGFADTAAMQTTPSLLAVMKSYWTQFANRGDPNGVSTPLWPRYERRSSRAPASPKTTVISGTSRARQRTFDLAVACYGCTPWIFG